MLCNSNPVESATQTLHRLTSVERYDEAREIEPPVDDPGVVQGFTPMALSRNWLALMVCMNGRSPWSRWA